MTADEIQAPRPGDPAATAGTGRSMWDNFRDVILAPGAAFDDVGRNPRWLGPLIVIMVATVVTSFLLMPMSVEMQKLAMMKRDMPADQREQALQMIETFKWVGLAIAPIMVVLLTAVYGLFFWAWSAVTGAKNASFKVAFAALLFTGAIPMLEAVAKAIVLFIKGAEQVAREGPPTFGLALFIDLSDMSRWMWALMANVNFFSIWNAAVVAIAGIYALRMSKGSAYAFAVVVWLLNILWLALQAPAAG